MTGPLEGVDNDQAAAASGGGATDDDPNLFGDIDVDVDNGQEDPPFAEAVQEEQAVAAVVVPVVVENGSLLFPLPPCRPLSPHTK